MYDFGKLLMDDRHYRIFVVLSYKVFVRRALVSYTEVSHALGPVVWELFHGERLVWREEKPC